MTDPLISMAFFTALLGSGHCIGMCGGLVAALSLSPRGREGGWLFQLFYNFGRVLTYTLLGILVGWLGSTMALTTGLAGVTRGLLLGSDLLIIVLGLGTAGLWEKYTLWQLEFKTPLQLLNRTVMQLKKIPSVVIALPLGLLMGFLPCGFLYAMVLTAAQSASPLLGGLIMLSFGIGTIPALLLFGGAAQWMSSRTRRWLLRGAGTMVALMGAYNLLRHWKMIAAGLL
jgi:uncharacterized protein